MLLDTDILIDLQRRYPPAIAWFAALPLRPFASGLAAMEFIAGARNRPEQQRAQRFLLHFPLLWPTEADLARALGEYVPLRLAHGIGLLDCVIAATATGAGLELATFNVTHFRAVPELVTVQPYAR